ncbi:MAG TPA: chloride channel protein [Spirochaetota bacterium]|nr:chloride channel protein [Spirochaetota bacterium]HOM39064.1 chloride channel protein [Spirochaetota bacterium]HPQ49970.1 chloride channel protein [Spirochaetota bacterium]
MKKTLTEESILFISVLKWIFLAIIIGFIVGILSGIFLKTLHLAVSFTTGFKYYFLLLPFCLFISRLLIKYISPDATGTNRIIEILHLDEKISYKIIPAIFFSSIITISGGGSAGKEAPCADMGAVAGSILGKILRLDKNDIKKLVICGISAGFASVFGTPVAGAIFGVEVLYVGSILYEVLLPSFIAGIISFNVTSSMGLNYFYYQIDVSTKFSSLSFLETAGAGIFFGLISVLFIEINKKIKKINNNFKIYEPLKSFLAGIVLIILTFILSDKFLGLGIDTIISTLKGEGIVWYAFLAKMLFTAITLSFCGGGVITPILFIGATAGSFFADIFNLDRTLFAAMGVVSLLSGATNTPIASSIMAVELFGSKIATYSTIAVLLSFIITGHRSILPAQILLVQKSKSINVEIGEKIGSVKTEIDIFTIRPILRGIAKIKKIIRRFF